RVVAACAARLGGRRLALLGQEVVARGGVPQAGGGADPHGRVTPGIECRVRHADLDLATLDVAGHGGLLAPGLAGGGVDDVAVVDVGGHEHLARHDGVGAVGHGQRLAVFPAEG